MIDTLKLHLQNSNTIRIESSQAEKISVTTKANVGTGEAQLYPLATMSNGKFLDGTKAYLNTDTFQLDLTSRGAFLKFSMPKVYHGGEHNIYPIGKGGASKVFDKVEQSLADNGVDLPYSLNSEHWKVSRADLFNNAITEYPFYAYNAVFSMLQGKRLKGRQYGGTGFLWANKSKQVSAYDKIVEHIGKGGVIPKSLEGANMARVEFRAMTAQAVRKNLPFANGGEVLSRWGDSRQAYTNKIQDLVFRFDDIQEAIKLVQLEEIEKLKAIKANKRYYLQHYLNMVGVSSMLEMFGGWDGIRTAFMEIEPDPSNRRRKIERLEKAYFEASTLMEGIDPVPVAQLYEELKTKLLSEVA